MSVQVKTEILDENDFEENYNINIYKNNKIDDNFESVDVKQEINENINNLHLENKVEFINEKNDENQKFIYVRKDVYENPNNNIYKFETEQNFKNDHSLGLILNEDYTEARDGKYMMCAAKNCRNNNNMRKDLYYFKFPRDPEICKIWIENCKRLDIVGKSAEFCHINHRLCSIHFELSMFAEGRLLPNAVPTLFPTINNVVQNDQTEANKNYDYETPELPPPNPTFSIKSTLTLKKYQCTFCLKKFPTKHSLTLHVRIHSGERPYECTKCLKTFQQIANLKTHMLTHTQEKKFECAVCKKRFSQRCHLTKHNQIHEREKLLKSYRDFLRKNPGVKYESFKMSYEETDSYLDSIEIKQEFDDSSRDFENSSENGIDDIQIKMEHEIEENENGHRQPIEESNSNQFFVQNATELYYPQRHSGKNVKDSPYQCKVCNRCYVNDYSLKVHERIHTGIRPYKCHICKKEFFQSSNLKTHVAKHNSDKKFQCKTCNKRFMFEFDLKHHETCHDKEKALECVVCHKTFSHRGNLLKHEKIHTGVKRFACPECDKQFYDGSDLRKHLLVHSKEKPFECQICNRKFSRHTYLKGHMSVHRNDQSFECDECFKVFSTRSLLRRHQARHKAREIGIKPYYCEVCDLYFSQTCSLKKHKKTPKHKQLLEQVKSDPIKNDFEKEKSTDTIDSLQGFIQPPKTDKEFSSALLSALKTNILQSNPSLKSNFLKNDFSISKLLDLSPKLPSKPNNLPNEIPPKKPKIVPIKNSNDISQKAFKTHLGIKSEPDFLDEQKFDPDPHETNGSTLQSFFGNRSEMDQNEVEENFSESKLLGTLSDTDNKKVDTFTPSNLLQQKNNFITVRNDLEAKRIKPKSNQFESEKSYFGSPNGDFESKADNFDFPKGDFVFEKNSGAQHSSNVVEASCLLNSVIVMVSDKSKLNIEKSSLVSSGVDILIASEMKDLNLNKFDLDELRDNRMEKKGECIKYFPSGVEIYKL